jgi:hypothetical protein
MVLSVAGIEWKKQGSKKKIIIERRRKKMTVRKKTETLYEVEFDEHETQNFADVEDVFNVTPEQLINEAINMQLRSHVHSIHNILRLVARKQEQQNGNSNT